MDKVHPFAGNEKEDEYIRVIDGVLCRKNTDENITTPLGWVEYTKTELTDAVEACEERNKKDRETMDLLSRAHELLFPKLNLIIDKFKSGNSVKVERITIRRDEWFDD